VKTSDWSWISVGLICAFIVVMCLLRDWHGLCGWIPALWFALRCAALDMHLEENATKKEADL
jgi:hypothetical protein